MLVENEYDVPYFKLKGLIVSSGLKQSEVAEMIDMDRSLFNLKVNRKKGRDFYFEEAIKIAEVLNVKVDDFF